MKPLTGPQLAALVRRHGWIFDRVNGSHHIFAKDGKSPIAIPFHGSKTLRTGTQLTIMRAAGISRDEL